MKKLTKLSIIVFILLFAVGIQSVEAQQGCCSWHGGINSCGYDGYYMCKDGTRSPSCTCTPVDIQAETEVHIRLITDGLDMNIARFGIEAVCQNKFYDVGIASLWDLHTKATRTYTTLIDTPDIKLCQQNVQCSSILHDIGQSMLSTQKALYEQLSESDYWCGTNLGKIYAEKDYEFTLSLPHIQKLQSEILKKISAPIYSAPQISSQSTVNKTESKNIESRKLRTRVRLNKGSSSASSLASIVECKFNSRKQCTCPVGYLKSRNGTQCVRIGQ